MKINKFLLGSLLVFGLVFSGCGGGGGSSETPTNNVAPTVSGVAQLGYISNGIVELFELTDLNKSIASTKSSTSTDMMHAGSFTFENITLNADKYYLVKVSGGKDIDPNDDGVIDANEAIDLNGSVYTLAKGSDLKSGIVRINALSDMAYQKLKSLVASLSTSQIDAALKESAKEYLYDIDGDGEIDNKDILAFNPAKDNDKTKKPYRDILDIYVPKLHSGESDEKKLSSLMYLDNPRIVVENGNLREVPFLLKATIENAPNGVAIKWFINSTEKASINETISEDGIYQIIAELSQNGTILKTVNAQVIATTKVEIASVDVDVTKDNTVFITDESNSSLSGAQVVIPQGALAQNTKITIKKSSVNSIPTVDGIGISDVIVMEPSGLTFDKPIQIRIPYADNIDLENQTIRVARYSADGTVDYITPLFVDENTHEVVFETEHFTDFKLTLWGITRTEAVQETKDLANITELKTYSNEEWNQILNVTLDEKYETTIYDLYLNYNRNSEIVKLYDDGDYIGAYKAFYSSAANVEVVGNRWNDIANIYDKAKLMDSTYETVKDNVYTLVVTKKYLSQIASNFGVIIDSSPLGFVKEYTDYVFTKAFDILAKTKDMEKYSQIEYFFTARKDASFETINKALKDSCNSQEHEDFTIASGIYAKDGLLRNSTGASYFDGRYEYAEIEKFIYSANLIYELVQNFKSQDDTEHKNTLRNIIIDIKTKIDYDSSVAYYENHQVSNFKAGTYSSLIAMNAIKGEDLVFDIEINTKGYTTATFTPVFELKDENRNIIAPENSNYIVSSEFTSTGVYTGVYKAKLRFNPITSSGVYRLSYFIRDGIQINDDHGLQLYDITVKKSKTKAEITGFSFQEIGLQKDSNGNITGYSGKITPTFASTTATPPCDMYFKIDNNLYGREFTIAKDDFNKTSDLKVYIEPTDASKESYDVVADNFTFNLKAKIDRALAGEDDVTLPSLKIVKKNGVDINVANQKDSLSVTTDDTLTFRIDTTNVKSIIAKSFNQFVLSGDAGDNQYLYTVKYTNESQYNPNIKLSLTNGSIDYVYGPHVSVVKQGNNAPVINVVADTHEYQAGDIVKLNGVTISDSEESVDQLNIEWSEMFVYSNVNIVNPKTISAAYFIAPTLTEDKRYYYKVKVEDSDGGLDQKTYSVLVKGNSSLTKQLTFLPAKETYADDCSLYTQTGCEKQITNSDPEIITKSWTFKNSGSMTLSNLKMVPVDNDRGNILTYSAKIEPSVIEPNEEFTISLTINMSKNVVDGVYGERWYIQDGNFNSIKFPEVNGVSADAQMWYKFKLNRGIVSAEKTLTELLDGKTTYSTECGVTYTSYFNGTNMLNTGDNSSASTSKPYSFVGNTMYMPHGNTQEVLTLDTYTDKYVQLKQENNELITLYFSKNDALNNSLNDNCSDDTNSNMSSSYYLNGSRVTATDAMINLNLGGCQSIQVNIVNKNVNPRDQIQITTSFHSKAELDDAIGNGELRLESDQFWFGFLHDNVFPEMSDSTVFSITLTKNSDGSYNVTSTGDIKNNEHRISSISALNVEFNYNNGESNSGVCADSHYQVDNTLNVEISFIREITTANAQVIATFNKDMKTMSYSTSGSYTPTSSYWRSSREFVMDLSDYTSGGSMVFNADGFITVDNMILTNDVPFIFP